MSSPCYALDRTGAFWYYHTQENALAKRKRYEDVMLLAAGEQVPGHNTAYVVDRVVGMGAFGAVYSARDPQMPGRHVALKEFFPARHPREQANLQALFDRERTVGMQASPHPLMPSFYEAFQHDGHFYIAQEFIEGATLDEIIFKRHPLPREWILKWAVSLCDALAFLHSRQVVHHDLKPANIRITPQGHLALLDFGAAQYFGDGHSLDRPIELYGTEGYLPPELEGDGHWVADVRTDIFAVGCVLYEMIAGVAPDQDSINERSMYVTNSLIQRPNADLGLVKLINKALSYNTDYRYASANDFLLEMRQIAPPVLLVTRKNLRWGEVPAGHTPLPQTVTVYNAGGGAINVEIKPRAPWIAVPVTNFKGTRRDVAVQVNVNKIAEREKLVTGRLEINSADQRNADGEIVSTGDKWFIECNVTVIPHPARLVVTERPEADAPPIALAARKGQPAAGTFEIKNVGEKSVEFTLQNGDTRTGTPAHPQLDLTLAPASGTLGSHQSQAITLQVATGDLASTTHETAVTIRANSGQTLTVPLSVRVLSGFDYLKSKIGMK